MSDIVMRLRQTVRQGLPDRNILDEAAAEIERLQAALQLTVEQYNQMVEIARRALEPKP